MLAALLLPVLLAASAADAAPTADASPLPSRIAEVVVHAGGARVRRTAQVDHAGLYLLAGLPGSLDADNLRVRLASGAVLGVEVTDRWQQAVPDAEVQALRAQLDALTWQKREVHDRRSTLGTLREHIGGLLAQQDRSAMHETEVGKPDPAAWQQVLTFAAEQLAELDSQLRDADKQAVAIEAQRTDVQARLDLQASGPAVHLRDVTVEVSVSGPVALDVEYFVEDAGWAPRYDLRTSADGTSVDLSYRAQVWQRTGETWDAVDLVLSTSRPQRGAQGPDPVAQRLYVERPGGGAPAASVAVSQQLQALGYLGEKETADAAAAPPVTLVVPQGLSVQFKLPRRESVPSRDRPSTVLIGEQTLPVTLERLCVPALDSTVWVRGLARNDTPWTMLPGSAAVYFGQDYVGESRFAEAVLPEQEFTLHLGADPALKVERVKTDERHEEPGMFSKRQTGSVAWRVRLTNNGATPARPDGSVDVLLREAMPLPADERIEVEVADESSPALTDERWLKDLKEKGIRTWLLAVPRGGSADLSFRVTTIWPENTTLEVGS